MGDIYVWLLSFFCLIALLLIVVFQLMCLAGLDFLYVNSYNSAGRINTVIPPEFKGQGLLGLFYLHTGHWFMALLCVAYMYYNFRRYCHMQHQVDVSKMHYMLKWEKKQRLLKLGYLVFLFLLSVFRLIYNAWHKG